MSFTNPKHGENKGIAKARKLQKREEAEERNARTPIERTRRYRLGLVTEPKPKRKNKKTKGYDIDAVLEKS